MGVDCKKRGHAMAPTATRILDVAETLVQTQGYNGFSYADVSEKLGIRKASLHHHFPTKAELGEALIERYQLNFLAALVQIDATAKGPRAKLDRYAGLYRDVVQKKRMCLCGMLAAEFDALPSPMRKRVETFFERNAGWLAGVLDEGRRTKQLRFEGSPRHTAQLIISTLEGAMLVARSYGSPARFDAIAKQLLAGLA